MNEEQKYIDFESYERVAEPHKRERASAWRIAIGLQDVDGLRVSEFYKDDIISHWITSKNRQVIILKLPKTIQETISIKISKSFSLKARSKRLLDKTKIIANREIEKGGEQ